MKIICKWFEGERPQFNVELASAEGREAFITIKGCRIMDGRNGAFVSWPATKNGDKWWNHVYASESFAKAVLDEAQRSMPRRQDGQRHKDEAYRAGAPAQADDDIPF
jgi:DNA-binding cell septation regulator SpoVG